MSRFPLHLFGALIVGISFFLTSYFGSLNPHPSGLLSSFLVFLVFLCLAMLGTIWGARVYSAFLIVMWSVQLILTISNWWYFQYFQSYFNYEVLALGGESVDALKSLAAFDRKISALVLGLVSGISCWFSLRFFRPVRWRSASFLVPILASLFGAVLVGLVLERSFDRYRSMSMFALAPSYVSPVHAFFIDVEVTTDSDQHKMLEAEEFFRSLNGSSEGFAVSPQIVGGKYNVIVIALESLRASLIGYYSGGQSVTPHLDRFARENIVARNFYANSNFTVKGETAMWCGIFDYSVKPPYSQYSDEIHSLTCLPKILSERGYETYYFHGNKSSFYRRDLFLPLVGFKRLVFVDKSERQKLGLPELGWGVSDEAMYLYMLEILRDSNAPFFSHFTTISSHYPFHWDWGIEIPGFVRREGLDPFQQNYLEAAYYEDYAFGKFWQAFRDSPLAENTIVLVTADHGIWSFADEDDPIYARNEQFFRMPLIIYHPKVRGNIVIEQIGSQLDIAPTLAELLGMGELGELFIGKNILQPSSSPWAIMMKSGDVSVRLEDKVCFIGSEACSGAHQECVAKTYGEVFLGEIGDLQQCLKVSGDLLRDYRVELISDSEPLVERALSLITLHNRRVFDLRGGHREIFAD